MRRESETKLATRACGAESLEDQTHRTQDDAPHDTQPEPNPYLRPQHRWRLAALASCVSQGPRRSEAPADSSTRTRLLRKSRA
jgi:hypothetical protein